MNFCQFIVIAINVNQLNRYDWNLTAKSLIKDLSARDPEKVSRAVIDFINTKLKSNPVKANGMESELAEKKKSKLRK